MPSGDLFEQVARKQAARTARLIGRTDASRLRWLVKFARTETFDRITSSKFKRIRHEIMAFADLTTSSFQSLENPISREAVPQMALDLSSRTLTTLPMVVVGTTLF